MKSIFGTSASAKSAILTHLKALNFDLYGFLHFFKAEIYQMNKIHSLLSGKNGIFSLLESTKLISRKILLLQKS